MNMLSIGGSDPSSGAGIQNDVRTAQLLGIHCFTVITAITSQNTARYSATDSVPPETILSQIESVTSDFEIDVIKIGMVYDSKTIAVLHDALKSPKAPIVVDPVMKSTTGGCLLKKEALEDFRKKIVPMARVITPNVEEAEAISGIKMTKKSEAERISSRISTMGAENVIITGIDENGRIADYVKTKSRKQRIVSGKIMTENHGGGCTFSSALAVAIARGDSVFNAARFANEFARKSIIGARRVGKGVRMTEQKMQSKIKDELAGGISKFVEMGNAHRAIPECQTNFVFSKDGPRGIKDIAGIAGRIVRAGDGVVVAGEVGFGGSRHVAAAVLETNRKFPEIRSGINVKYDVKTLNKLRAKKLKVLSYDRAQEPASVKKKENSSVAWGIRSAIAKTESAPDVIFHKGDVGKEPMILVFGEDPQEVVGKIEGVF